MALLLLTSGLTFGQITEDPEDRNNQGREPSRARTPEGDPLPFSQRLRFGLGMINLQFGNARIGTPLVIGVSPIIAYNASERLIVGAGINYLYRRFKLRTTTGTITENFNEYGARGFAMFELIPSAIPNLYAHGELETNRIWYPDQTVSDYRQRWVSAPLVGLTYMQPVSRRFGINLTALYNLNYNGDIYSRFAYNSPWVIRVSFF